MTKFSEIAQPGMILNMSTGTMLGGLIRAALGKAFIEINGGVGDKKDCPNHDAIVVEYGGRLFVGDAVWPRCTLTPVKKYDEWLRTGEVYNLRLLRVRKATTLQHQQAAKWWLDNVNGKRYDIYAFPRLLWKATVGDLLPCAAGMEWAWYCSEGVKGAFDSVVLDIYMKNNPTPLTTYKRMLIGILDYVTKF
jgi:hypothetical protein